MRENVLGIPERDWDDFSDHTMCIWNTYDETVILFVPYVCVTHMAQSFYSLMPIIYCLKISYSNRIEYTFFIIIVLTSHRSEFSISIFTLIRLCDMKIS